LLYARQPDVTLNGAIATCLRPVEDPAAEGFVLRPWEVAGRSRPLRISIEGYRRARQTDLLERDLQELPVENGAVTLDLAAHGFAAARLAG
jgi:hypothetical protein